MSNLKWKRRLANIFSASGKPKRIILLYHSLGASPWAMSKQDFQDQINWLTDNCQVISLNELIVDNSNSDLQVALTFDDGYQSLHDLAAPILADKNINAAVYLNTGWIGESHATRKCSVAALGHYPDEAFLTWTEVHALSNAGWLIGSHGVNHHNFTIVDEKLALQELTESKRDIESHLGLTCNHFAYPFGRYTNVVKSIAKQSGYQYAVSACHGRLGTDTDKFALPRINIDKNYTTNDFINIIKGKWDYLSIIHKIKGL